MPNQLNIKNKGLFTYKNYYSNPEGAMTKASNVVIDRDDIVEPRRGLKQYGNALSNTAHRVKQLFDYKNRLLRHTSNNNLQYDSDGLGNFTNFTGTFTPATSGLRIRSVEQNGNLFFLTSEGVKKLSTASSSGLSSASIINAGGVKSLSLSVIADYTSIGFLEPQKQCAYKIVWGYKDENEVLVLGVPSERVIVQNLKLTDLSGNSNANTLITSNIPAQILNYPASIKNKYFYQIYRTIQTNVDIDPGEEFNLVFEDFPTSGELTAGQISAIPDITPDDIRVSGALLYINPTSGEGIAQANEAPPFAKDITTFKGYTFYANTSTVQRLFLDYLSIEGIVATDELKITDGTTTRTYAYQGALETYTVNYNTVASHNDFKNAGLAGKYFFIDAATVQNAPAERSYYLWFFATNETDPGLTVGELSGKLGIKVDISGAASTDNVATTIKSTLEGVNGTIDFNTTIDTTANTITIKTANNGWVQRTTFTAASGTHQITNLTVTKAATGLGEDSSTNKIFLPYKPLVTDIFGPSTSQQLEQVALSTINVINDDASAMIYGFYQSGPETTPGKMLFEQRTTTGAAFRFYTLDGFQDQFTPTIGDTALSTVAQSTNETRQNRIYYSKFQQPEAVPLVNYFDIGPKDKQIQRIVSLRDALFVFKEEGIYRVTNDTAPFSIQEFDSSVYIRGIDSVAVLNNQIYTLTSQGIVTVTDTGVGVISRNIENLFSQITRPGYSYETSTFGVAYETDRAYLLFTVSETADTVATICYRYNTFTQTWTSWDVSATCGIVKFSDNKLYIGASDIEYIEQERKNLDITDYCDREYELSIGASAISGNDILVSSTSLTGVGDAISQIQYLTIAQYNRLLRKLDDDTGVNDTNYESLISASTGDNLRNKIVSLANKLDLDSSVADSDYFSVIDTKTGTSASVAVGSGTVTITKASHGIQNGRYVTLSSSTTTPSINGTYQVSNVTANTFDIPTTVTVTGTVSYTTDSSSFKDIQACFNVIVNKLNLDASVFYSNYALSSDTTEYRALIDLVNKGSSTLTVLEQKVFIEGPITLYKAIPTIVQYSPIFGGDPTVQKQFSEGTFRLEANNYSKVTISYASDLSPSFESQEFTDVGTGEWGDYSWDTANWGGIGAPIPIRAFIPTQKQRSTFIIPKFEHKVAIQKFSLMYLSLLVRPYSTRSYKGK
jgi:hypothetical protein